MSCRIEFSRSVKKRFDLLDRLRKERIGRRIDELAVDPFEARLSGMLAGKGGLRKSRVGGWRLIFTVDREARVIYVVTLERRGQACQRL